MSEKLVCVNVSLKTRLCSTKNMAHSKRPKDINFSSKSCVISSGISLTIHRHRFTISRSCESDCPWLFNFEMTVLRRARTSASHWKGFELSIMEEYSGISSIFGSETNWLCRSLTETNIPPTEMRFVRCGGVTRRVSAEFNAIRYHESIIAWSLSHELPGCRRESSWRNSICLASDWMDVGPRKSWMRNLCSKSAWSSANAPIILGVVPKERWMQKNLTNAAENRLYSSDYVPVWTTRNIPSNSFGVLFEWKVEE